MYKSDKIPNNFNKVADISDNFIIFVKENTLDNDQDYEAYIQYLQPSFYVLHTYDYRITTGDSYSFDYNYVNNGLGGSYIDSADYNFTKHTYMLSSGDTDFLDYSRGDFPSIFVCQFILVIIFIWVFKQLSRLFFKGGLC